MFIYLYAYNTKHNQFEIGDEMLHAVVRIDGMLESKMRERMKLGFPASQVARQAIVEFLKK